MNIVARSSSLSGHIRVPGSKSHTIRALLLSSFAEGVSHISNPLPGADCISTARALPLLGASVQGVDGTAEDAGSRAAGTAPVWTVTGAGKKIHLPDDVVNVGDSGSLLYFMSPIAATFPGWSVFTGDESIRRRPVDHVVDALRQLGADAYISRPGQKGPPLIIHGPITAQKPVVTGGQLSQYVSGMMMAASRMDGTLHIELTDPKEVPYLTMTKLWLESYGVTVNISPDFHHIAVTGPVQFSASDRIIPSDWEAVAFPLIAALVSDSSIIIDGIDGSGSQGDDAIVAVLQSVGADIVWDREAQTLAVRGGSAASDTGGVRGRLSAEQLPGGELRVNLAGYPDAVCALAAVACYIEGTTIIEDIDVCRRKETDRIEVLKNGFASLGVETEAGADYLAIHGHGKLTADGRPNPQFHLHGGTVESFGDHRVAMAYACLGLGLPAGESLTVQNAECCAVSFPRFFETMNKIGAGFLV